MRSVLVAIAASLFGSSAFAEVATDNPRSSSLDMIVQAAAAEFFKDACHVGLSIGVYDSSRASFYNYGTTNKARPSLPTSASIYEIGSITKTFTGTLAAKAVLDGKMSLDDDFRPALKGRYPNLERDGQAITLRRLALHASGMPKDIPNSDALFRHPDVEKLPYQMIELEHSYNRARYLRELHDVQLATVPGQAELYSNIGIKLIGFGLENVYGKSYAALLRTYILGPLDMTRTTLSVPAKDKRLLVTGYSTAGAVMPYHLENAAAAGGLYSTTEDMMKYAAWQLDESNSVIARSHAPLAGDAARGNGLIWHLATRDGERRLDHSGGVYGMSSYMALFPDARTAMVLLANDGCLATQNQLEAVALGIRDAQKLK